MAYERQDLLVDYIFDSMCIDSFLCMETIPMTKQEIWHALQSGLRFTVTSPGDWEFCIRKFKKDWRLVMRRVR